METARLEKPTLKNRTETVSGSGAGKSSTVNFIINLSQGNTHNINLSVPVTALIFSNLSFSAQAVSLTLILKQDGTGNRRVLWPNAVQWPGNITPTLSTAGWSIAVTSLFPIANGASSMGSLSMTGDKANRKLIAFGRNDQSQLGDGTAIDKSSPVQIGALTNWASVSGGSVHSLATKTDGTLWAFGNNSNGQLGSADTFNISPAQIGALTNWASVASGAHHSLGLKTDGTIWSFGKNNNGQLGDGTTVSKSSPVQIGALTNWASVASGWNHSFAIKTDSTVWSWGSNSYGQLGDGTAINKSSPVQIGALTGWASVAGGSDHSLAIMTDGTLWTWGSDNFGQLGNGGYGSISSPAQVGNLTNWTKVVAGYEHSLALKTDGTMWSWGYNAYGQLGDGTNITKSSPVRVGSLTTNWTNIAAGFSQSFALKADGTLWSFGSNNRGRLGDQTTIDKSSPVQIGTLTNWASISGGINHFVGLKG